MKALVTGSHGFLGSHLVKALSIRKWEVIPLKRELLYSPNELKIFCEEIRPDYIFHLAAYGNMSGQQDIPLIVLSNILGTFNLLQACNDISYKGFINFGSSSEYGYKKDPMVETDIPEATTFYGVSKIAATYLAKAFSKQFTKPIVTVRPFSVYGPGEAPFRFIPTLISYLGKGNYMDFDLQGKHDWIYISDIIKGVLTVADNINSLFGQVVNIGTGIQSTNTQVQNLLEKISEKTLNINYFQHMRPDDSPVWVDGSKKLRLYGWKPKVSLEEGLRKCYEYYRTK